MARTRGVLAILPPDFNSGEGVGHALEDDGAVIRADFYPPAFTVEVLAGDHCGAACTKQIKQCPALFAAVFNGSLY